MPRSTIIIGAGSAGCVLARRLSEDPARTVLLLEAGPVFLPDAYPEPLADADRLGGGTEYDWGYQSEPGRLGYPIAAKSGKVLGGGSAINAGVAKRARPDDFTRWQAHGLDGWSFAEVLPAYKALESTAAGSDDWHGRAGPFPIRQPTVEDMPPALRAFVAASVVAGFKPIDDPNGAAQRGISVDPFNVVDGVRCNTGMVYLSAPVRNRKNLIIRGNTHVDRIEFADDRASAVRLADGELLPADEIVLSAGAYGSPAILLRSGIGPAAHLAELGIAIVADLPVGERLFDHPFYYNTYALKPESGALHPARGATVWTRSAETLGEELDLQVTASNRGDERSPTGRTLTLATAVTRPRSAGSVRLSSRDPRMPPRIDYNLLSDPHDRNRMLEGVKLARRIGRTPPLADLIEREMSPGQSVADDAALLPAIESELDTYHHGCCTVPMGGAADRGAVVDAAGCVRGLEGLRVVDASIFPEIPSTPTNLTTIMLAERIAGWIAAHPS